MFSVLISFILLKWQFLVFMYRDGETERERVRNNFTALNKFVDKRFIVRNANCTQFNINTSVFRVSSFHRVQRELIAHHIYVYVIISIIIIIIAVIVIIMLH